MHAARFRAGLTYIELRDDEEIGIPALRQHLWQVIGIGNSSNSKEGFERAFYRAFPEAVPIGSKYGQFELFPELA